MLSLARLRRFASKEKLEQPKTYRTALTGVLAVLQQETGFIQLQDLPTIIIPDLHSRRTRKPHPTPSISRRLSQQP